MLSWHQIAILKPMNANAFDYYLALLQLQMAILGFVIAGIVALMQLVGGAKPKRQASLLIRQGVLVGYVAFLSVLLIVIAVGCWVAAFPRDAEHLFGLSTVHFFASSAVLPSLLGLSIAGLFVFAWLTYKSRKLLDDYEYVKQYAAHVHPAKVRTYLEAIYSDKPQGQASKKNPMQQLVRPFDREQIIYDPFQPIREYTKDNAFKSYDYGTAAGLKFFSKVFDATLATIAKKPRPDEFYFLARYMAENALELFSIFEKNASEKRKLDVIRMTHAKGQKLLAAGADEGLVTIVRGLEGIAKLSNDDDEVIEVINSIHSLTDAYLDRHKKVKWATISTTFEEVCLSVTRISETYYLQKDNPLKTVPIIGHYTGEHRTVTAALVEFFCSYRDLADRYTDAYPMYYFEAIEAVIEALFARLADIVRNGQQHIGLNRTYYDMTRSLSDLYLAFGIDAIEHKKPELLALSMGNLRRIVKPAKNLKLADERTTLTSALIELAVKGIVELGDVPLKGERSISMYTIETCDKHATHKDILAALVALKNETPKAFQNPAVADLVAKLDAIR